MPMYQLKLTGQELRLIGLALSGRLKEKSDIEDSKALNMQIAQQKLAQITDLKNRAEAVEKASKSE